MTLMLRPQTPTDFPAIAAMESDIFGHRISAADVALQSTDVPFCGIVAELDGQLVGRGYAGHMKRHTPAGDMRVELTLMPEFRRRGIGRELWVALQPFFAQHAPRFVRANGNEASPEIVAWAQRLGFAITHHLLFQSLNLAEFALAAWQPQLEAAAQQGIRFVPFASLQSPATERQLHALYHEFLTHTPDAAEASYMDFEPWRDWAVAGDRAWPAGCLVAVNGDDQWLGFTLMQKDGAERAHVFMTGIVPKYRGLGLANALKVAAAVVAQEHGVQKLTTLNHAANERIVAVNRRLGYKVDESIYRMVLPYGASS